MAHRVEGEAQHGRGARVGQNELQADRYGPRPISVYGGIGMRGVGRNHRTQESRKRTARPTTVLRHRKKVGALGHRVTSTAKESRKRRTTGSVSRLRLPLTETVITRFSSTIMRMR